MSQIYLRALSKTYGFSLDTPVKDLPPNIYRMLLYGNDGEKMKLSYSTRTFSGSYQGSWEGFCNNLARRYRETSSDYVKSEIEKYMSTRPCETCNGKRLKKEALAVTVGGLTIVDLCDLSVKKALEFINSLTLTPTQQAIARLILKEINKIALQ